MTNGKEDLSMNDYYDAASKLLKEMAAAYSAKLDEIVLVAEIETWMEDRSDK